MSFVTQYAGDNSGTGLSPRLWGDCPLEDIVFRGKGIWFFDDFLSLILSNYVRTQATAGTFSTQEDAFGGVGLLDCDSATQGQGINVQHGLGESFLPAVGKTIWMEGRFKMVDAATAGPQFFFGLHETDTTIIAANAMSGSNYLGLQSVTDNKVMLFAGKKATVGATQSAMTMVATLTTGVYVKWGCKIETAISSSGVPVLAAKQYIDGVLSASELVAANIPVVEMRPSWVNQCGVTAEDTIVHMDWVSFAQLR
jgi:hypothetical protein